MSRALAARTPALVVLSALGAGAHAAPPAKFFGEGTFMTMRINLPSISVDNAKAAINALVTQADLDAAGIPMNIETDLMPQVSQLGMVQMMTMSFVQNGADKITVTMQAPAGSMEAQPNVNILMPANSDAGAQQMLSFAQGMGAQMGLSASKEIADGKSWVVLTPPGSTMPSGEGSAALAGTFEAALAGAGDHTITFAMVPSEQMLEQSLENVQDEQGKEMVRLLMKANWMSGWMSLDGTPEIGMTALYPDAEAAQQVEQAYKMAMGHMVEQAKEGDAQVGEDTPAEFRPSAIAERLTEWMGMERDGSRVTVRIDPGELRQLVLLGIKAGPALQNNPMFGEMMRQMQNAGGGF